MPAPLRAPRAGALIVSRLRNGIPDHSRSAPFLILVS